MMEKRITPFQGSPSRIFLLRRALPIAIDNRSFRAAYGLAPRHTAINAQALRALTTQRKNKSGRTALIQQSAPSFVTRHPKSIRNLNFDVAEPNIIVMILKTNVAFVIIASAIVQQFKSQRPCCLTELTFLQHFRPLRSP